MLGLRVFPLLHDLLHLGRALDRITDYVLASRIPVKPEPSNAVESKISLKLRSRACLSPTLRAAAGIFW